MTRWRWETPTGCVASGMYVGQAAQTIHEHKLRDILARQVHGYVEVKLGNAGRADVATATDVFEVEPFATWRHGLRQVMAYAWQSGLRPNLAVFGPTTPDDRFKLYRHLSYGRPPVRLWLGETMWNQIGNRQDAIRRPA